MVPVVILDFGSQFTQLIARLVRDSGVYCEILPFSVPIERIRAAQPKAIVLSGGPASVGSKAAPKIQKELLKLDLPTLGICYGMQLLSHLHAGKVSASAHREYGLSEIEVLEPSGLFEGFEKQTRYPVWMSHGDSVTSLPEGARLVARSQNCPVAAFQWGKIFAVQFHPEVAHTPIGPKLFGNFLFRIAKLEPTWKMTGFVEQKAEAIRRQVGKDHVIGAVSGGVDSTVLAVFLGKTLGKQFHPVFVDNGLLRHEEARHVRAIFDELGIDIKIIKAEKPFLAALKNVRDPEVKRKRIGKLFIELFERECKKLRGVKFLAQGTLYPDVIESVSTKGPSATIKTHHNVGGLPKRMKLGLVEPFRELFKDEVRQIGKELHVPEAIVGRHPFPGPGLAVRVLGAVSKDRLDLLRAADHIFISELRSSGLYDRIWQAFAVLLPVQAVGVMGDSRTYEAVVALRAVTSRDGMTADWFEFDKKFLGRVSNRIINEVRGINRVVYDISQKPPATIEWE